MGRVLGWGLGCILVLLCLCLPCICCLGIWFLGWFGYRRATRPNPPPVPPGSPLPTNTIIEERVPIEESGADSSRVQRVIYTQGSDR
ncbi:hypothetical protein FO519_010152, partial [Halicephalobus sp. NKZ332]